jgi:hypothetical protein
MTQSQHDNAIITASFIVYIMDLGDVVDRMNSTNIIHKRITKKD